MKKVRKEFTFDLDTNILKNIFGQKSYTRAYNELFNFFCKCRDFEHRQGSVYCSSNAMENYEVLKVAGELYQACPWIATALRRMDVADIGEIHELTEWIMQQTKVNSKSDYAVELLKQQLQDNGFTPTESLNNNYLKLTEARRKIISLESISDECRAGSADKLVNAIGKELEAQELQHIKEAAAGLEI